MLKTHLSLVVVLTTFLGVYASPCVAQQLPGYAQPASADDGFRPLGSLQDLVGSSRVRPGSEISVSAQFVVDNSKEFGVLQVRVDLAEHWHIYSVTQPDGGPMRTRIVVEPADEFKLVGEFQPDNPPSIRNIEYMPVPLEEHGTQVIWSAQIRIEPGVNVEQLTISGQVDGQICEEEGSCVPLSQLDTKFAARFDRYEDLASVVQSPQNSDVSSTNAAAAFGTWSLLRHVLLGLVAGLLLNLMPCVLPVIGLKILSFTQQAGESRGHVFALNLYFVAGILTVFMGLACLAAFLGWGWGAQFQRPEFGIFLAAVVFVFALSFLGVWEIPIPGFVGSGKAAQTAEREGPVGAYTKGILTTLLATPCSGPLIVPTLTWALLQAKPVIFATFFSLGLGMGLPYLVISLFPGLMRLFPKPGAWMETFKHIMGFILLATIVWIMNFLDAIYFVPTLALLFALWAACWWVGRVPLTANVSKRVRAYASAGAFAAVIGFGAFSILTPASHQWPRYSPAALSGLQQQGVTVFVDFTADWCISCKANENLALNRNVTREFLEDNNVAVLVADKTRPSPDIDKLLVELGNQAAAVPFYAIFPGDGSDPVVFSDVPLTTNKLFDYFDRVLPVRSSQMIGTKTFDDAANSNLH